MSHFLKKHPFAVEAYFKRSTVLAFAFPKEELTHLIPDCLALDTFDDKWGFIAAAMVQTKEMRPKGFPKFLGNKFFLMGYRVFVRYTDSHGKTRRGLYILKSQTDCRFMQITGNIFTDYHYEHHAMSFSENDDHFLIQSPSQGLEINVSLDNAPHLPIDSPFADWREARRFSGPMPFTFSYHEKQNEIVIIEGVRSNWKPTPLSINHYTIPFIDTLNLHGGVLANAFKVENVPYYWKKGVLDPCP